MLLGRKERKLRWQDLSVAGVRLLRLRSTVVVMMVPLGREVDLVGGQLQVRQLFVREV